MNTFNDNDMSKEARSARYKEFCGLKFLPFRVKEQTKRMLKLEKLRIRDNRFAFNNDKGLK